MSAAKFTPGPWLYLPPLAVGGEAIVPRDGPAIVANAWPKRGDRRREEHAANNHLIAAAPDLYEALADAALRLCKLKCTWRVLAYGGSDGEHTRGCEARRAALAKARGET